jgi:triosephosphate isomerase
MDRQRIVAGNWKLNGSATLIEQFSDAFSALSLTNMQMILCVPYVYLSALKQTSLNVGAQNVAQQLNGAFTGEISTEMLCDVGAQYVIVGHSERRELFGETNTIVACKVEQLLLAGLTPILCIGESLATRESGEMFDFLQTQLDSVVERVGVAGLDKCIVAYEPIWAIGTGVTASPAQAQEVHAFIRNHLSSYDADIAANTTILYGGSVNAKTASDLFAQPDIDGGLVGGASLKVEEFMQICQAANN